MGTPCTGPERRTRPMTSLEETISGSRDIGMSQILQSSSSHCWVDRSISMVREAFVTSVTCLARWRPCLAPERRPERSVEREREERVSSQITQVSIVPKANSPRSARSRAPSTLSRIQRIFDAAKYVDGGRPVRSWMSSRSSSVRASTRSAVRVSCQTIAL